MTTPPRDAYAIATTIAELVQSCIDASGIPLTRVAAKAGMARTTLGRKLVDGSFTITELVFLARALGLADDVFVSPVAPPAPTSDSEVA